MQGIHIIFEGALLFTTLCASAFSQTTPSDMDNCCLDSSSPFSWVVQIWDEKKDGGAGTASIGSLITYRAVLTTAWYFSDVGSPDDLDRYIVYGQRIWDLANDGANARTNLCRQERKIMLKLPHPKSSEGGQLGKLLFDFSIIVLNKVFNVSSPIFPIMHFRRSPVDLLLEIQRINSKQPPPCKLPIPESESNRFLIINSDIDVTSLLFHNLCINYICEDPGSPAVDQECANIFNRSANATMLCVVPKWTKSFNITSKRDFPNFMAGAPLVCNDYGYGLSTQLKRRGHDNYSTFQQSFFFVITLLRVWKWLMANILFYSPEADPFVVPENPKAVEYDLPFTWRFKFRS